MLTFQDLFQLAAFLMRNAAFKARRTFVSFGSRGALLCEARYGSVEAFGVGDSVEAGRK